MRKLPMSEILKTASEISSRKEKIDYLRYHYTPQLHKVLEYALNPDIKFALPEGHPPYTPTGTGDENGGFLYGQVKKLHLFMVGGHEGLDNSGRQGQMKREKLFTGLLESVHPEDAKLLIAMKDNHIPYKGITRKLITEAFGEYRDG